MVVHGELRTHAPAVLDLDALKDFKRLLFVCNDRVSRRDLAFRHALGHGIEGLALKQVGAGTLNHTLVHFNLERLRARHPIRIRPDPQRGQSYMTWPLCTGSS